jgi:hypothetical protein
MKSRFYKIKCTAASDQILNCQPKIVILNNICHSVTSKFCVQQILFLSFRYSGPVNSWCSLVLDQWPLRKKINPRDYRICGMQKKRLKITRTIQKYIHLEMWELLRISFRKHSLLHDTLCKLSQNKKEAFVFSHPCLNF